MKIWQNVHEGLNILMWNFIMFYQLVSKIYQENLKISAIIGRLPVTVPESCAVVAAKVSQVNRGTCQGVQSNISNFYV